MIEQPPTDASPVVGRMNRDEMNFERGGIVLTKRGRPDEIALRQCDPGRKSREITQVGRVGIRQGKPVRERL